MPKTPELLGQFPELRDRSMLGPFFGEFSALVINHHISWIFCLKCCSEQNFSAPNRSQKTYQFRYNPNISPNLRLKNKQTNKQTNQQTNKQTNTAPNIPFFSASTKRYTPVPLPPFPNRAVADLAFSIRPIRCQELTPPSRMPSTSWWLEKRQRCVCVYVMLTPDLINPWLFNWGGPILKGIYHFWGLYEGVSLNGGFTPQSKHLKCWSGFL